MRKLVIAPAVLGAVLFASSSAAAQTVVIRTEGAHRTVTCDGSTVLRVPAAGARVHVTGRCRAVIVNGANTRVNAIIVDHITINGTDSRVTYVRSSTGRRPTITINGVGSKVFRVEH